MKVALSRHKPEDSTKEEFSAAWDNAGYILRPLYKYLLEQKQTNSSIKVSDFGINNHYELLVYEGAKREVYQELIDLLPDSAKYI